MLVTKFLTHVTKLVIRVTNFVTNLFCADSENYLGIRENLLGIRENLLGIRENLLGKKNPPRKLEADKRRGKGIAFFSEGLLKGLGRKPFSHIFLIYSYINAMLKG